MLKEPTPIFIGIFVVHICVLNRLFHNSGTLPGLRNLSIDLMVNHACQKSYTDEEIHLDACLTGIGANSKNFVYHGKFPKYYRDWDIAAFI